MGAHKLPRAAPTHAFSCTMVRISSLGACNPQAIVQSSLADSPGSLPLTSFACVGDVVDVELQENLLRGHGTQAVGDRLVATACGVVERVNKLVTVRSLRSRYGAEVGGVVVGRIVEVAGKRWRVDLGSKGEAVLLLSAVNLPGGVQRRRTADDELNMRAVFQEGDVISAEVQSLHHDGTIMLHTRSLKYGKLGRGQLVAVPPGLIKRQKQHFQTLPLAGVDLVLGCNGTVWVGPHVERPVAEFGQEVELDFSHAQLPPPTPAELEAACRVAQAVTALAALGFAVHPAAIGGLYQLSLDEGLAPRDMTGAGFLAAAAALEAQRRLEAEEG